MVDLTDQEKKILALLTQFSDSVQTAFLEAVQQIKREADVERVIERLTVGDIDGAIRALRVERAPLNPLVDQIEAAFRAGGQAAVAALPAPPGRQAVVRFDSRNPVAEEYLRNESSTFITNVLDDQIRMIRSALERSLTAGVNPRTAALEIVGRVGADGRRTGGVLGLSDAQWQWLASYEDALRRLDGSRLGYNAKTGEFENYTLRDRRWDRTVAAAIRTGTPVPEATIQRLIDGYERKALLFRGTMVARTEVLKALNTSADIAIRLAVQSGEVQAERITKVWHATHDDRTRFTHRILDGQEVGFDEKFESPSGARLMYPGDPEAPASEVINCRCWVQHKIDFITGAS